MRRIDLNCDMGESFGIYRYGADAELMPLISSANVACGFHAGDPHTLRKTVDLAGQHGVRIGAHVGLPDREGFGRRILEISAQDVYDYTLYQMGALDAFVVAANLPLTHVKLHGALYMMASERRNLSEAVIHAVLSYNKSLDIYALPDSELARCAKEAGLNVMQELFADRPYDHNGVKMFGWSLEEVGGPRKVVQRVRRSLFTKRVERYAAEALPYHEDVNSICIHSDTPNATAMMHSVRKLLLNEGFTISGANSRNAFKE